MKWFCAGCRQDRECKRVSTRPVTVSSWLHGTPYTGIQNRIRRWECTSCGLRFNTVDILDEDSIPRTVGAP